MLVEKYKVLKHGWEIQSPNYRASNLWIGILSAREAFSEKIGYSVGNGEKDSLLVRLLGGWKTIGGGVLCLILVC